MHAQAFFVQVFFVAGALAGASVFAAVVFAGFFVAIFVLLIILLLVGLSHTLYEKEGKCQDKSILFQSFFIFFLYA